MCPQDFLNLNSQFGRKLQGVLDLIRKNWGGRSKPREKLNSTKFAFWTQSYAHWGGYHEKMCSRPSNISSSCTTEGQFSPSPTTLIQI